MRFVIAVRSLGVNPGRLSVRKKGAPGMAIDVASLFFSFAPAVISVRKVEHLGQLTEVVVRDLAT